MRNPIFRWRSAALLGLLAGVGGCYDRERPGFETPGTEDGPTSLVTAPAEFDTVYRGHNFTLAVRVEDEDGVDSIWVAPSDTVFIPSIAFSGSGKLVATASYEPFVPNSHTSDTLSIFVRGIDLVGDTGLVYVRHLIVQ